MCSIHLLLRSSFKGEVFLKKHLRKDFAEEGAVLKKCKLKELFIVNKRVLVFSVLSLSLYFRVKGFEGERKRCVIAYFILKQV